MILARELPMIYKGNKEVGVILGIEEYHKLLSEVEAARRHIKSGLNSEEITGQSSGIGEAQATYTITRNSDTVPSHIGSIMTFEEMQRCFSGEWVLIGDPELTDALQVIQGTVVWHSPNRDQVYEKMGEAPQHQLTATWYFWGPSDTSMLVL